MAEVASTVRKLQAGISIGKDGGPSELGASAMAASIPRPHVRFGPEADVENAASPLPSTHVAPIRTSA